MTTRVYRPAAASLLASVVVVVTGCSETSLQGVILDQDLNTPDLMVALARGVNSEVTDIWAVDNGYQYDILSSTDDYVNDGTANGEVELSVSDYTDRPGGAAWGQSLEASWAGIKAASRMREVLGEEAYQTSPLVARVFIDSGYGERALGDAFCEAIYNFGPNGGFLLPGEGEFDGGKLVPRDSTFQRAATLFELGLGFAERAVAAGEANPAGSDPLFEPQRLVYAAHAGAAQAYMAMASLGRNPSENWALAVEHARAVPTEFVEYTHLNELTESNDMWNITWNNDDVTMWGAVIDGRVLGTPATALWGNDPRVSVTHCGDFEDPAAGIGSDIEDNEVCAPNDDYRSESNDIPDWAPNKYPEEGSDIALVRGTGMRLIEAEAALVTGNLAEFTNQVNIVRAFYGAGAITQPLTAGALEWPNAEDDAWSILDRERYLTLWLEGRRAFDLSRWHHPWFTEGHSLIPRHGERITGARAFDCMPVPSSECNINPLIQCPVLGS